MRQLFQTENIRILTNSRIVKILSDQCIAGLVLEDLALHRQQIDADGLFVAIGRKPNTDFLPDCLSRAVDGFGCGNIYPMNTRHGPKRAGSIAAL